jgi:hypothetical protein
VKTEVVFFDEEITGTIATTPKSVLGSSTGEDGFCSSETEHNRRTAQRTKVYFGEDITGTTVLTRKVSWVRVSVKILGLGIIIIIIIFSLIFSDTYRMIRPMISFRTIKVGKKGKHLSNFPAVTQQARC